MVAGGRALCDGVWNPIGRSLRVLSKRSPELAVLFYVTDDDRAGEEVERLIRTAGFEPVKAGGIEQSGRLEVGGNLHDLVVGPTEARSVTGGPDRSAAPRSKSGRRLRMTSRKSRCSSSTVGRPQYQ